MKRLLLLLSAPLFGLTSFHCWAQETAKTPKFVQRQQHFESLRHSNESVDFGKARFQAIAAIPSAASYKRENDQWTPIGPESGNQKMMGVGRVNAVAFHPTDSNTYFICVGHGGVWKTTNNGESWASISANLPISRTSTLAIHPSKPETMYVALGDIAYAGVSHRPAGTQRPTHYGMGIYKTVDGGKNWQATGLSHKISDYRSTLYCDIMIHPDKPETVLALGMDGCHKSTDGGATWKQTATDIVWDAKPDVSSNDVLYASTGYIKHLDLGNAGMMKSEDFGETWTAAKTYFSSKMAQRIELATCPSDPKRIYALACNAIDPNPGFFGLFVSTDAGATFNAVIGTDYEYNLLGTTYSYEPIAVGQGTYDLALWVDEDDANEVYVGGINLWKSTNGGKDFLPASNWKFSGSFDPLHADVHQIQQNPLSKRYFVCHDGGISSTRFIKSTSIENADFGFLPTQWKHYLNNLNIKSYYRLGVKPDEPERVMAGSQDNGTDINYSDGWSFLSGGDGQECAFDAYDHAYTTIQYGMLQRWADFGSGKYQVIDQQNPPEGETGAWTTPFLVLDGTVYIAYGNLYKHLTFGQPERISDFGNATGRDEPLPTTGFYMSPANAQKIYVAKRGYPEENIPSEIWHSPDEGKNWTDVSEGLPTHLFPTYIIGRESAPKNVWITFGGFSEGEKVYASTDFGETWKNISYDLPNVSVNCVAHQNDKTRNVYVGTDAGVFYLDAENETWLPFAEGLPNVIVTELEASASDGMLKAATFGRGLWEVSMPEPVGIDQPTEMDFNVYPNPSSNSFQLTFGAPVSGLLQVRNATGQVVYQTQMEDVKEQDLPSETWLSGSYFVSLYTNQGRSTQQLLKLD